MPSTVYKGDVSEVLFAPETGLTIRHTTDSTFTLANSGGVTTITFGSNTNTALFDGSNRLKFPVNSLVGSHLTFDNVHADVDGKVFTIIENDGTAVKISPEVANTTTGSSNVIFIHPYKTPPMDSSNYVFRASATGAPSESLLIDQFLGIANAITLPETKFEVKRYHVVGLGRETSVQVPGKIVTEGGSFEVNLHSARWLKYCLGGEVIGDVGVSGGPVGSIGTTLGSAANAGDVHIEVNSASNFAVGKYVLIQNENDDAIDITPVGRPLDDVWDQLMTARKFDKALPFEIRRITAVHSTRIYLDEPLQYDHKSGVDAGGAAYGTSTNTVFCLDYATPATGAPQISSAQTITNPITHLLYGASEQPSFCLEVSQRRSNVDKSTVVDGSQSDTKELTRIYRGCKVTDFTLTTDNDAALRLSVNFNAALCYTDTGRLDTPGTSTNRYNPHRMFDDTAQSTTDRLKAGIGVGTQKPFMFYNGQINVAGRTVAQVHNFSLSGQTGMQAFHTINNTSVSNASAESQVPFAGSRNTSIMVEGQTSYEMTLEIVVDDPIFFHKMRSQAEFSVSSTDATTNQIVIDFEKQVIGSTDPADSERITILIDEYYIVEAPMQIPEDKGVMKSTMKIMPKSIKVLARDTILKY